MRVVRRHLFLLPICGGSAQVQFACEQTSRRSQTRIVSLNRERGELESGATAALRQGAFVGIGLFRRLGQVDEQERGERGLFCAHWATCRACPTLALDSPGKFRWTPPVLRLSYFNNLLVCSCAFVQTSNRNYEPRTIGANGYTQYGASPTYCTTSLASHPGSKVYGIKDRPQTREQERSN